MSNILERALKKLNKKRSSSAAEKLRLSYIHQLEEACDLNGVFLEARNGKEIDGNIYYVLKVLLGDEAYDSFHFYVSAEPEKLPVIRSKLRRLSGEVQAAGSTTMAELSDRISIVTVGSGEYFHALATCRYIVCDATLKNFFIKRPDQIYVNLWHGTPFKVMGRRVIHEPHAVGNAQKNFTAADYLLYPNEYMMKHMVEDYMIANTSKARVLLSGYPRNSAFYDASSRDMIRASLGLSDKKVYIYMPTHRPSLMGESLQQVLEELDAGLRDDELLFAKIHPLASESIDYGSLTRVKAFPSKYETYEFLNIADLLITDYSSVFYDFAVTRRKIVLYTYDEEEYLSTRGLYEPMSGLPFDQAKTMDQLFRAIRSPKLYDDIDFISKYCRYDSADAAEKLCRRIFSSLPADQTIQESSLPSNGLENVLVYVKDLAPGEDFDRLMKYLDGVDTTKANYFITFHRKDVTPHKEMLFKLPEGVDYFGRSGSPYSTGDPEKDEELEQLRSFGGMRIDRTVDLR